MQVTPQMTEPTKLGFDDVVLDKLLFNPIKCPNIKDGQTVFTTTSHLTATTQSQLEHLIFNDEHQTLQQRLSLLLTSCWMLYVAVIPPSGGLDGTRVIHGLVVVVVVVVRGGGVPMTA